MASSNNLKNVQQLKSGAEIFHITDFITAVPSGATSTGTIQLPPGLYYLSVWGTQTAASTDPTFALAAYTNAAQTASTSVPGGLTTDTGLAAAIDLELAQTALLATFGPLAVAASTTGPGPVFLPYGLAWTYTKNGGSAINLSLSAQKVA